MIAVQKDRITCRLNAELRFPVFPLTQSRVCLEGFALFGNEALEQAGLALRAKRLDLLLYRR